MSTGCCEGALLLRLCCHSSHRTRGRSGAAAPPLRPGVAGRGLSSAKVCHTFALLRSLAMLTFSSPLMVGSDTFTSTWQTMSFLPSMVISTDHGGLQSMVQSLEASDSNRVSTRRGARAATDGKLNFKCGMLRQVRRGGGQGWWAVVAEWWSADGEAVTGAE